MKQLFEALARQCGRVIPACRSQFLYAGPVACILVSFAVSGCVVEAAHPPPPAVSIPKPTARLMAREATPKCTYSDADPVAVSAAATDRRSDASDGAAELTAADPEAKVTAALETVERRERERDCFRDSEQRVRAKLMELQASVRAMVGAMEKQKVASSR